MFTREESLILQNYLQKLLEKPRRIQDQPHTREGIFVWCQDWEIIEILKYLINGAEAYAGDPPPNRLKFNPLWSKEAMVMSGEAMLELYKTPEAIVEALKDRRVARAAA